MSFDLLFWGGFALIALPLLGLALYHNHMGTRPISDKV